MWYPHICKKCGCKSSDYIGIGGITCNHVWVSETEPFHVPELKPHGGKVKMEKINMYKYFHLDGSPRIF